MVTVERHAIENLSLDFDEHESGYELMDRMFDDSGHSELSKESFGK